MTIRALLNKDLFAPKFFANSLKKSWTNFLLYFIVCFFSFPVPIMISTSSAYYYPNGEVKFEYIVERVLDMLGDLHMVSIFVAAAIAIFAGCAATKYLNSKTSAYFYHSLPIKREALYFSRVSIGVINYICALALSSAIGALVILLRIGYADEIALAILSTVLYSLLVFLLFFFVTVFVGMFCGTGAVQFVMCGVVLFFVPATLLSYLFIVDQFTAYIDTSWYIEELLMYTSPAMRIFYIFDYPLAVWESVLWVVLAAALAVFSIFVYRKRGNENAGNPIVFSKVAIFAKYAIMVPATIALGIWFGEMGGGLWQIFGFAAGALLCSMLLNSIFQKNARAMFKGVRGLIIFCVVFGLCYVGAAFDVLGTDSYIPGNNLISKVELKIEGQNYGSYTDKELIDSLKADLERHMKSRGNTDLNKPSGYISYADVIKVPYDENVSYDLVCKSRISVQVIYHSKFGLPIAKYYGGIDRDMLSDTLRALADSDEFEKNMYPFLSLRGANDYENVALPSIRKYVHNGMNLEYKDFPELFNIYKNDLGDVSYESFQYPQVGYIEKTIRDEGYYYRSRFEFPIMMNSDKTLDLLLDGRDVYDLYLGAIHSVNVYRVYDEKDVKGGIDKESCVTFTDEKDIREILSSIANATDNYDMNVFCEYDYRYLVEIRYFYDAEKYDEKYGGYDFNPNWLGPVSYFINGKVPAFVEAKLGE